MTIKDLTGVQLYDGRKAWQLMPFAGDLEPRPMSPAESQLMAQQADFDGPLVDAAVKGNVIELVGPRQVRGAPVWTLRISGKDGLQRLLSVGAETFLDVAEVVRVTRAARSRRSSGGSATTDRSAA